MPIYEYQCPRCGTFEVSQRITEAPLRRCPTCKGKVSKLISQTSFQLKGSGWYVTDYSSKGNAKGAATEDKKTEASTDKTGSGEKQSSSSDTKPSTGETKTSGSGKTEATAA